MIGLLAFVGAVQSFPLIVAPAPPPPASVKWSCKMRSPEGDLWELSGILGSRTANPETHEWSLKGKISSDSQHRFEGLYSVSFSAGEYRLIDVSGTGVIRVVKLDFSPDGSGVASANIRPGKRKDSVDWSGVGYCEHVSSYADAVTVE
jgi:hypothetical protein